MIRDPVCGMPLTETREEFKAEVRGKTYYFCGEYCKHVFLRGKKIAYFSMEIGLNNDIHTYSGGLGVLAGDMIKSSADLKIPLVGVTLVSRKGYLRQEIKDGKQTESPDEWTPSELMTELPTQVELNIQNRKVRVKAWPRKHCLKLRGAPEFWVQLPMEPHQDALTLNASRDVHMLATLTYARGSLFTFLNQREVVWPPALRRGRGVGYDILIPAQFELESDLINLP